MCQLNSIHCPQLNKIIQCSSEPGEPDISPAQLLIVLELKSNANRIILKMKCFDTCKLVISCVLCRVLSFMEYVQCALVLWFSCLIYLCLFFVNIINAFGSSLSIITLIKVKEEKQLYITFKCGLCTCFVI